MGHQPPLWATCSRDVHFDGPPLEALQHVCVSPVLRTPHLDAVLQVMFHQCRVEGQDHLPWPAGHASFDAAQDMVSVLGCEDTVLPYVQLPSTSTPKPFSILMSLSLDCLNPVQDLALGFVEPHDTSASITIQNLYPMNERILIQNSHFRKKYNPYPQGRKSGKLS